MPAEAVQTEFGLGETVELNGVRTTLLSVKEYMGTELVQPAEGHLYVLCEFDIDNGSSNEISISSIRSFEAYCDDYAVESSLFGSLLDDTAKNLTGSIPAGKKIHGSLAYEVPSGWEKLEIEYKPSYWSGKDVRFIVEK